MRDDQPSGTVTLVFSDIEGSTRLLHELGAEAYRDALADHRAIVRAAYARYGGYEVDYEGDAFFFTFSSASDALSAVSDAMAGLDGGPIRIRVGIHTGEPILDPPKYVGMDVHLAARVMSSAHGGQVVVSEATAALVEQELRSLGSYRLKDIPDPVSLHQLGEGSFPPLKTIANSNLPVPASSFLGRQDELYEADLLLQQTRMLTVLGPGGQGKTRFALELATRAREERFIDYPDGVFGCFLASLRDPELVLPTIGQTLAVREQPGLSELEALTAHIHAKKLLLLIDNAEHLLGAAAKLSQLLSACPTLTLLVTSRERLRIAGETPYALSPLPAADGVALFCDRAQIGPSIAIAELATGLEGLPLAIELAAARTAILTPEQLLERLSSRLDLLEGGRDADPRQQTLRATIEWSYDLLTPAEQELFARLSVFEGGCTLTAAEAVCDADLESLQGLVDKSLLRFTDGRFSMLETLREFATQRLEARNEREAVRDRHADAFLALAEAFEPPLIEPLTDQALLRLPAELANLRAAIDRLATRADPSQELRLVGSLFRLWERAGLMVEGRRLAERALARVTPETHPAPLLKALYAAAMGALDGGDWEAAVKYSVDQLHLARRVGDPEAEAAALLDLGNAAHEVGDLAGAISYYEQTREVARAAGNEFAVAVTLGNLAEVWLDAADFVKAASLAQEAIERSRALNVPWDVIPASVLGWARLELGEPRFAAEVFHSILSETYRAAGPTFALRVVVGLAASLARRGSASDAARLLGMVERARVELGTKLEQHEETAAMRTETECRQAMSALEWAEAQAVGTAMTLEEGLAYALQIDA